MHPACSPSLQMLSGQATAGRLCDCFNQLSTVKRAKNSSSQNRKPFASTQILCRKVKIISDFKPKNNDKKATYVQQKCIAQIHLQRLVYLHFFPCLTQTRPNSNLSNRTALLLQVHSFQTMISTHPLTGRSFVDKFCCQPTSKIINYNPIGFAKQNTGIIHCFYCNEQFIYMLTKCLNIQQERLEKHCTNSLL